ncbi:MAG TPA: hypothetical protein VGG29_02475 [Caulobacteraceae bacterium]|jgi:hypothetical protein
MARPEAPAPRGRESVAARFRREIEQAEARGADRADMTLKLTLGDASNLRRDRGVPLTDISFTDGVMRYLGVAIVQGGISESALSTSQSAE